MGALVLSREKGQEIVIAEQITIRVARIKGKRVSLVVAAPKEIAVRRGEVRPINYDRDEGQIYDD